MEVACYCLIILFILIDALQEQLPETQFTGHELPPNPKEQASQEEAQCRISFQGRPWFKLQLQTLTTCETLGSSHPLSATQSAQL